MNRKKILKAISLIDKNIKEFFDKKYDPFLVNSPSFYFEDSELILPQEYTTRPITFDFGDKYETGTLPLDFANWRRLIIKRMELSPGDAIMTESSAIWRDSKMDVNKSITKDEISLCLIMDENQNEQNFLAEKTQEMINLINDIALKLKDEFGIKNTLNNNWPNINSQLLENEMPDFSTEEKEVSVLEQSPAFVFNNPGARTIQGKVLKEESPLVYDLNKQNHLIIYDNVNFTSLDIASVGIYARGLILSDQINAYALKSHQNKFYTSIINNEIPKIIEIKINKSLLYLALLGVGHIGEVQASGITPEQKKASNKTKINFI